MTTAAMRRLDRWERATNGFYLALLLLCATFIGNAVRMDLASGRLRLLELFTDHGAYGDRFAASAFGGRMVFELTMVVAIGALFFAWTQSRLVGLQMRQTEEIRADSARLSASLNAVTVELRKRPPTTTAVSFSLFGVGARTAPTAVDDS